MHNNSRYGAGNSFTVVSLATALLAAALVLFTLPASGQSSAGPQGDTRDVERLKTILESYYTNVDGQAPVEQAMQPDSAEKQAASEPVQSSQATLNTDKVQLSGSEGTAVFAQFTRRLRDPRIPELHRDVAPICTVKTRLFDTLVSSERLSLKPVGKHHYVGSIKLQPGESTFAIKSQQWLVKIPEDGERQEHVITFYRPPGKKPQFHTVAIQDMIAAGTPTIPKWLPPDIADQLAPQ